MPGGPMEPVGTEASLNALFDRVPAGGGTYEAGTGLPECVERYFAHAIAPGARLANAVRLRMRGEIKLGAWRSFEAEEVIARGRGMVWTARTRLFGIPVSGFDRYIDGRGEMRWKLLGVIPLISQAGPDISRSAAGRLGGESMWLPSMLCDPAVRWEAAGACEATAHLSLFGDAVAVRLTIGPDGGLRRSSLMRWGNPNGQGFAERPFGACVDAEGRFEGYTIPTEVRAGWEPGATGFGSDGEFFRCTLDAAIFK